MRFSMLLVVSLFLFSLSACDSSKEGSNPCAANPCNPCAKMNPCASSGINPCAITMSKKEKKGYKLWKNKKFGKSTNAMACQTCHPNGSNLDFKPFPKYINMAKREMATLEHMVNFCIKRPMKGKAISRKSKKMKRIVAFYKLAKREAKK